MNQTSPAATGTAGVVIAGLVAIISVLNTRLALGLSAQDQVSIAAGIVVTAHWVGEQYAKRSGVKAGRIITPSTPQS